MRRSTIPLLTGAFAVATAVAVGRNVVVPRVRTASPAEIEAVLPASLKTVDAPDPSGEARYARLVAYVDPIFKTAQEAAGVAKDAVTEAKVETARANLVRALGPLEALLAEGDLRCPLRRPGQLLPELTRLKSLGKGIAACAKAAATRGDRDGCARLVALDLRLGDALVESKGVLIDELVAVATAAVADRTAYEAEMAGGLDAKGRARVLALMPSLAGPMPELGDALRRDFRSSMMPFLSGRIDLSAVGHPDAGDGNFDALATARLLGQIDDAEIADAGQPFRLQTRTADRIAAKAAEGLPAEGDLSDLEDMRDGFERDWSRFRYRMAMNAQPNSIGRDLARTAVFDLGGTAVHRAAGRDLARAALMLHAGIAPYETDPYGVGSLKVDPKRRIVWSVGSNGKDDGGQIGKGGAPGEADFGYPYGPSSWPPDSRG